MNDLASCCSVRSFRANGRVNVRAFEDLFALTGAMPKNVAERNINALAGRNFPTNDTCHKFLLT